MNVYPKLPGLAWPITRKPLFNNIKQETVSGRVVTATYMQYPLFEFTLTYNYLSPSDLQQLEGFFLQQGGDLTGFYFDAGAGDDSVTAAGIGSGDGVTTDFQLYQSALGATLPVSSSFGSRTAYVNGASVSATFETPNPGWVRFATAPASGSALTWTGSYYYQCRFKQSAQDFDEFMSQLYTTKSVTLRTYR